MSVDFTTNILKSIETVREVIDEAHKEDMQDIIKSLGLPDSFDSRKHDLILPEHMKSRFENPPSWILFSKYTPQNQMFVSERNLWDLVNRKYP